MSDWMFGAGQMLAVVVIVGGVTVALLQVWVLANKLARNLDREAIIPPAQRERSTDRRPADKPSGYR